MARMKIIADSIVCSSDIGAACCYHQHVRKDPTPINPQVAQWARLRANLDIEQAAKLAKTKSKNITDWEKSATKPSRNQVDALARAYQIPTAVFYMSAPPAEPPALPDFRTSQHTNVSPSLRALIDSTRAKQHEIRQLLLDEQPDFSVTIARSISTKLGPKKAAEILSKKVLVSTLRETPEAMFANLRQCIEEVGVFVIVANKTHYGEAVEQHEFSGFTLADDVVPFIVIHPDDNSGRRIFTLMHELVHVALSRSGISKSDVFSFVNHQNSIEEFCDRTAGELLAPSDELVKKWRELTPFLTLEGKIQHLKNHFCISHSAIAVALARNDLIDQSTARSLVARYKEHWEESARKKKEKQKERKGGPTYQSLKHAELGKRLIGIAKSAYLEGELSDTRAARLLEVSALTVESVLNFTQRERRTGVK